MPSLPQSLWGGESSGLPPTDLGMMRGVVETVSQASKDGRGTNMCSLQADGYFSRKLPIHLYPAGKVPSYGVVYEPLSLHLSGKEVEYEIRKLLFNLYAE